MDDRTGRLYDNPAAALEAGVPENHIQPVALSNNVIVVLNGPFKGRRYLRQEDGSRGRRLKDATKDQVRALLDRSGE